MKMKIGIPDMISNSYFPAAAAVELGFFKKEGLDMDLELIPPVDRTLEELRDGKLHFRLHMQWEGDGDGGDNWRRRRRGRLRRPGGLHE